MNQNEKKCSHCKQIKPITDFYTNSAMADGYHFNCKECTKQFNKDFKAKLKKDPEKYKKYKEWLKERNKAYYKLNRDKINEKQKDYYQKNKERIIKRQKEYYRKTKKQGFYTNIECHCYEYKKVFPNGKTFISNISFFASEEQITDWKNKCLQTVRDWNLKILLLEEDTSRNKKRVRKKSDP